MRILKTNTAVRIAVGPFVSHTDGYSLKTGITVTGLEGNIWHEHDDGSAPSAADSLTITASGGSNDMVELAHGYYDLELTASNTNFLGRAKFQLFDADVCMPYFEDWVVVPAMVYDSLVGGSDTLQADVTQFGGTAGTFSGGRAEVNTSHIAGSAVSTTTAQIGCNVVQISADSTAADNLEAACDGNTYNVGGGAVVAASVTGAVGSVTGNVGGSVASIASGGITAASIASSAITNAKFAAGAIDAAAIATGAIDADAIADNAIDAGAIATGAITAAKFAAGAIDASAIAADAIGASELAADAASEIGTAVWATAARTLTAATNITSTGGTTVPQTGDSYARIGAAGASLTAVPWNSAWDAEVQSECDDALDALNLAEPATYPTLTVASDAGNSATQFASNRTEANDFWIGAFVLVTSGVLAGQIKEIGDFANTSGIFTLKSGESFTGTPAVGVTMSIINR